MAVNYNFQDVADTLDLLKELREDSIQQEQYLNNMVTTKTDSFLLDFVKDNYDFSGLNDTALTITENLDVYIPWLEEANNKALNVEKSNIEKSGELRYEPTAGIALSSVFTPCLYGPRPTDSDDPIVQPLYGVESEPTDPTPCLYGPRPMDPIEQPLYGVEPQPQPDPIPFDPSPCLYGPRPMDPIEQPLYGVEPQPQPDPVPFDPSPCVYGPRPMDPIEQPLYGVEPQPTDPTPPYKLTPCVYGPRPADSEQPITPNPDTNPNSNLDSDPYIEPTPQPYIEPAQPTQTYTQTVPTQQYIEPTTQTTQQTTETLTQSKDITSEKINNLDTIDTDISNTISDVSYYNDITSKTTSNTSKTNTNNVKTTTTGTQSSIGVSKGVVATSAVVGAGSFAAGGLLFASKMREYKFSPEDWDELGPVIQERVAKALYEAGYLDHEINKIINSNYKIERAELNIHLKKIESAKTNYNKLGEEFGKIYNYSIINGGEVSKYLTFMTMIIDGKNPNDKFNMYKIINPYLEDPDDVNKTYIGIKPNKYFDK